jgi:hypothetical protein
MSYVTTEGKNYIPVFDLFGHRQERLLDVGSILSRRLKEWDGELIRKFLSRLSNLVARSPSRKGRTLATLYSTTFLLVKSDLLPTRSLLTPSEAYRSISCNHCLTFVKVSHKTQHHKMIVHGNIGETRYRYQ